MQKMMSAKKIKAAVVSAVVAFSMLVGITPAFAEGSAGTGVYEQGGKSNEITLTSITAEKKAKKTTLKIGKTLTVSGKKYTVTAVATKAFKGTKAKKIQLPSTIKKIQKQAFKGSKATTLIIKSKKLTKASVKGALKSSKIKTVKVPKSKVKAYKKIFTKKNCGKKVKVKAI